MRRDPNLRTEAFPLDTVQRWLQAVIVHPGDTGEALASEQAAREVAPGRLADLVKPSATLTAEEHVAIYHDMYLLRMEEALATDYPALKHFLGGDAFVDLVRDYVEGFPSRSYTLNRLGDHLPAHLGASGRPDAAFLRDLARAELAVSQSFDEAETPVLDEEAVRAVPAEAWTGARLRPVASLRLLSLGHPVLEHLEAYKRDLPSPAPRRKPSRLLVWRRDYTVYRRELGKTEHDLLKAIATGTPLGEAVAAASTRLKGPGAPAKIQAWFRAFVADGLFTAVDLQPT